MEPRSGAFRCPAGPPSRSPAEDAASRNRRGASSGAAVCLRTSASTSPRCATSPTTAGPHRDHPRPERPRPATAGIAQELNQQYFLGYPVPDEKDGQWHSIRVEVRNSAYRVRARRGYTATPDPRPHTDPRPRTPVGATLVGNDKRATTRVAPTGVCGGQRQTGNHKGCPYGGVRRATTNGQPQGLPLRGCAAGNDKRATTRVAPTGVCGGQRQTGNHKGCPYRGVRRLPVCRCPPHTPVGATLVVARLSLPAAHPCRGNPCGCPFVVARRTPL